MNNTLVRICEIKLNGFKNTINGILEMPSAFQKECFSQKADILGIYGQNGSGKTAIIEAMDFVQRLLMGKSLPEDAAQYIAKDQKNCSIDVTFAMEQEDYKAKIMYHVMLSLADEDTFMITEESLAYSLWNGEKFEDKKTLMCFDTSSENGSFTPKYRYKDLIRNNEDSKVKLGVAKKLSEKEKCSVIFSTEGREIFLGASEDAAADDYNQMIRILHQYATVNLFVIPNAYSGSIALNFMVPFSFRLNMGKSIAKGELPVHLDGPSIIAKKHYNIVQQILVEMNTVLSKLVPGLSVVLYDFGEQLLENGEAGHRIELISVRNDVRIPLKYESEGIIKIVSILNVLMCVYNDPSMCLVIDELDAGIYEYLLGELLSVLDKGAKGQLLFTSHNLRALEMLNKVNIVFSTTNAENRYIRLQNVKTNNNLRDMYLRSITLGGQKESVYEETDTVEIGRAFRRIGKVVRENGN